MNVQSFYFQLQQLRDICPSHRLNDLDDLMKRHNNDMDKMKAEVSNWWNEEVEEETWKNVGKKGVSRGSNVPPRGAHPERRGGRGAAAARGAAFERGNNRGGRGASAARGIPSERRSDKGERAPTLDHQERKHEPKDEATVPPVTLKSTAWGQRGSNVPATPTSFANASDLEISSSPAISAVSRPEPSSIEPNTIGQPAKPPAVVSHNVWATKGAAHLIEAEKVKQTPLPQKQHHRSRSTTKSTFSEIEQDDRANTIEKTLKEPLLSAPLIIASPTETEAIENGLSVSVNGANVNAAGWKPSNTVSLIEPVQVPVSIPQPNLPIRIEHSSISDRVTPVTIKSFNKPKTSLNMGQWETAAGEEVGDYSFGSFGVDNDVSPKVDSDKINVAGINVSSHQTPSVAAPTQESSKTVPTVTASIAGSRPPPGLAMPIPANVPIPSNVVHVHELETKLESASLAAKKDDSPEKSLELHEKKPATSQLNISQLNIPMNPMPDGFNPAFPQGAQTFLGAYGMGGMGMYNYNPQTFMAVPSNSTAPVISAAGLAHQQPKQQVGPVQTILTNVGPVPQPSAGVYPSSSAPSIAPADTNRSSDSTTSAGVAIPPGMHGTMPYNPALYYPGQQPFQMGQPHGAAGYGYGYGHVQGGFGYQHMMGQGGYGQHYDEQQQHVGNMNTHHTGSNHQTGYNKNTSGYRGRNPHHTNQYSQYQGQYGYGGQPYNIPYAEHFNQLGGYGPGGMETYIQNNGYPTGMNNYATQDDEQQSGNKVKGNSRKFSNPNINQYQQGPSSFADGSVSNVSSSYQGGWNSGL